MSKYSLLRITTAVTASLALGCGEDMAASDTEDPRSDAALPDSGAEAGGVIQTGTVISLGDGELEGAVSGGARHFFGIPYAEPPTGELRFRAPVKNRPWTGVRAATELPKRCAQPTSLNTGEGTDNEDCLYLNVWAPEPAPSRSLPVLVWIHGGGNQNGATSDAVPGIPERLFYDGQSFAEHHGVLMVSLNYRLGVFGFLSHPDLEEEGSPSGNQGLFDQRLALEWVQSNIAVFGGDPGNVTIFGESAGARNVCFHVVSPGSRGLFHRAISESGDCTGSSRTRAQAEAEAVAFVEAVGCSGADALSCLRARPARELIISEEFDGPAPPPVPGGSAYNGGKPRWDFRPTMDGNFVPRLPRDLFLDGEIADVPYLMGTNTEEGALAHLTAPRAETEPDYLLALDRRYGRFAPRIAETYPASAFPSPNDALVRVSTDERYACAVQDFARRASAAGLDVYAYNFDLAYAIPSLVGLGPAHGAELTFVFNSLAAEQWSAGNQAIADMIQGYWARFAASGDPNGEGAPEWPGFVAERDNRLEIDLAPHPVENFRATECAVWGEYYATLF